MRHADAPADDKPSFALLTFTVGISAIQLLILQCAGIAESSEGGRISTAQIINAWRARQERIRSARVVWVQDRVDKKGSYSWLQDAPADPFPPQDTAYSMTHTLQLDGDKWRLDMDGAQWNLNRWMLINAKSSGVWVDGITKRFTDAGEARRRNGTRMGIFGEMGKDELMGDLMVRSAWPIVWFLRPFRLSNKVVYRGSAEDLIILPVAEADRMKSEGVVVCGSRRLKALRLRLDAARDFLPVRAEMSEMGQPLQLNVTFGDDPDHGLFPSEWNQVELNSEGAEQRVITCRVTKWQINCEIPPSTFELQFPPGTEVLDELHQNIPRLRIADDKGGFASASRMRTQDRGVWRPWLLILNGVVLACLVAVFVYRKRRRQSLSALDS